MIIISLRVIQKVTKLSKFLRLPNLILCVFLLQACGGPDSDDGPGGTSSSSSSGGNDTTPPSGYSVSPITSVVSENNQGNFSVQLNGLESDATYTLSWSDSQSNTESRDGTVSANSQLEEDIDLSSFSEGQITFTLILTDSNGNIGNSASANVNKVLVQNNVVISGVISFDFIPHNPATNGLNYNLSSEEPARGIVVEAVDSGNSTVASTVTNTLGEYALTVEQNTNLRIRAYAQLLSNSPAWDIEVNDNTNNDALYVIQGNLLDSGTINSTRDLHASSGWGGSSYTSTRAAAPFAILDTVYESLLKISEVDPDIVLPAMQIYWSPDNRAISGNTDEGEIGSSYYSSGENAIFLLGSEDNDTDEYDRHIVAHEFGHYLDRQIFRSDSVGGSHMLTDELDMRVSFGEGFANAFAAMTLENPEFRDSLGNAQGIGFVFDVSLANQSNPGWFNEQSVHAFVYGIYQSNASNFTAIFNTLRSDDYVESASLTGVHLFGVLLKQQNTGLTSLVDSLANTHGFTLNDIYGTGETNDGGIAQVLPIYRAITLNGSTVNVCSHTDAGEYNKLGNFSYLRVNLPSLDSYTITATRTSGLSSADPDLWFVQRGLIYAIGDSSVSNSETVNAVFNSGNGVIILWDANNRDEDPSGGDVCFDVSISN